jgi:hypothetical protein
MATIDLGYSTLDSWSHLGSEIKTGPLLTLDRPENFQGKMAVFTPKLQFIKKIRQMTAI